VRRPGIRVVFGLTFLLSLGLKSLARPLKDDRSQIHRLTSLIGTAVSGTFL
jgi:high-affinity nickel-transport protein